MFSEEKDGQKTRKLNDVRRRGERRSSQKKGGEEKTIAASGSGSSNAKGRRTACGAARQRLGERERKVAGGLGSEVEGRGRGVNEKKVPPRSYDANAQEKEGRWGGGF